MVRSRVSLESILRTNGNFFKELTEGVKQLRDGRKFDTDAIKKSMIPSVIRNYSGINIKFNIAGGWEGSIYVPDIANISTIFTRGTIGQRTSSYNLLEVNGKDLEGLVDPATGKVGGYFSKLPVTMQMGVKYFLSSDFTDEEIASIILHEIGHGFTAFQYIATCCVGLGVVTLAANNLLDSSSYSERKVILTKAEELLGLDSVFSQPELIDNPKPGVDVLMLSIYMNDINTKSLSWVYDYRNAEQVADAYAVKNGAGPHLASALDKLHRGYNAYGKETFGAHLFAETVKFLRFIANNKGGLAYLMSGDVSPRVYDRPKDRIEYIRMQLIDDLKKVPKNDAETKATILSEIQALEGIEDEINYRRNFYDYFFDVVNAKGRKFKEIEDKYKALERMMYNDLFIKATQFKANIG